MSQPNKSLTGAKNAGTLAFHHGRTNNPYDYTLPERAAWQEGYDAAAKRHDMLARGLEPVEDPYRR